VTRPSRRGKLLPLPESAADADGTVDGDVIDWPTSGYDDLVALDSWKQPVAAATTADITIATALNAGDTLDGVTLAAGDRVLVKDQSDDTENGIWIVDASPYRAPDMDDPDEFPGAVVVVLEGTANVGTTWVSELETPPVIGTDPVTFVPFGGGGPIALGDLSDVTISGEATADRLRLDSLGEWRNSPLIWTFATTYDGTNWLPVVDGAGNVVLTEADPNG